MVTDDGYYFCLRHHAVEPFEGCKAEDRLGPYPSREAAEQALRTVEQRNKAWDEDPRFHDPDDDDNDEDAEGWGPFRH